MMEPNDNPKKKPSVPPQSNSKPKKRKRTPKAKESINDDALQGLAAFFAKKEDPAHRKHKQDLDRLHGAMGEYLSSYIVIGYTVDGKSVNRTYANNSRDMDALSTGLQKFIVDTMSSQFPPGNFE